MKITSLLAINWNGEAMDRKETEQPYEEKKEEEEEEAEEEEEEKEAY